MILNPAPLVPNIIIPHPHFQLQTPAQEDSQPKPLLLPQITPTSRLPPPNLPFPRNPIQDKTNNNNISTLHHHHSSINLPTHPHHHHHLKLHPLSPLTR